MNKNKFEKDEIVLCIDNTNYKYIKLNKKYKIINIHRDDNYIIITNENNETCAYSKTRFILLKNLRKLKIDKILNE